jgi:hypothetical protein
VDQWRREIPDSILQTINFKNEKQKQISLKFPFILIGNKSDKGSPVISNQDLEMVSLI